MSKEAKSYVIRTAGHVDANGVCYTAESLRKAVENWKEKYRDGREMTCVPLRESGEIGMSVLSVTHAVEDMRIEERDGHACLVADIRILDVPKGCSVSDAIGSQYFRFGLDSFGSTERDPENPEVWNVVDATPINVPVLPVDELKAESGGSFECAGPSATWIGDEFLDREMDK